MEITGEVLAGMEPGEKVSYVHLVRNKLKLPDGETRASLLESTRRFENRIVLSGVVVHEGGFWASAVRSFVTGIAVLGPRELDLRIFGGVQQLIPWFTTEHAKRTGVRIDGDALLKNLEQIEASCTQLVGHDAQ